MSTMRPSKATPTVKSTEEAVEEGSPSHRRLSSIGTIIRKLKRDSDPDGGETPTCKKKLFGGTDLCNEGGTDGFPPLTLSASILNSFASAGTLGLNASVLTDESTGTLVINSSFFNESTGTLVLDEDFDAVESTCTII